MIEAVDFQQFAAQKARDAATANIERLSTVFDWRDASRVQSIGNAWSRLHFGGEFGLVRPGRVQTAMTLGFVQTVARKRVTSRP